jgi:hypothetical protein
MCVSSMGRKMKRWLLVVSCVVFGAFLGTAGEASPKLSVTEAGGGAQNVLTYSASAGSTQKSEVSWNISIAMDMGGMAFPMDVPEMKMGFLSSVQDASQSGVLRSQLELTSVKMAEADTESSHPMAGQMVADMQNLVGVKFVNEWERSGRSLSSDVKDAGKANADMVKELSGALGESLVVFPTQPVGVGAKWTVTEDRSERGVQVRKVTSYELLERTGTQVKVRISISGEPLSKTVNSPELPPGTTGQLTEFKMTGGGTATYDLARILPLESSIKVQVATKMNVTGEGQTMALASTVVLGLGIRSESGP